MNLVLSSFNITIGMFMLTAVMSLSLLCVSQNRVRLFSLTALCVIGTAFQILSVKIALTNDLAFAIELQRWRACVVAFYIPFLLALLASYLGGRAYYYLIIVFALGFATLAVANLILPYGIKFSQQPELLSTFVEGTRFYYLVGLGGVWSLVWFIALFSGLLLAVFWAVKVYRKDPMVSLGLAAYLIVQLFITAVNIYGQTEIAYVIQTDGFALVLFVLFVSIGVGYNAFNTNLELKKLTEKMQLEVQQSIKLKNEKVVLARIVEEEPVATHIVDAGGRVLMCNSASREFWQQDLSESQFNLIEFIRIACQQNNLSFKLANDFVHLPELNIKSGLGYFLPEGINVCWLSVDLFPLTEQQQAQRYCIRVIDISHQKSVEEAVKKVASAVTANWGSQFYSQMVRMLNQTFNSDYAFIARISDDGLTMHTVAVAHGEHILDNFSYSLEGTPCAKTQDKGVCWYPNNVQQCFPNDLLLQDLNVQGYLGAALTHADSGFIGVLAVMSVDPIEVPGSISELLDVFVARVSAEFQLEEAQQKIKTLAYYDYLTELPNRAQLQERLSFKLSTYSADEHSALLMLDLDNFKYINDSLGNDVADQVLREVGRRLNSHSTLMVARYGGDEFVVISEKHTKKTIKAHAIEIGGDIIESIEKPIQIGNLIVNVSATIGVCIFPLQSTDRLEILSFAETALIQAKKHGRGLLHLFDPEVQQQIERKIILQNALKRAIEENQLTLAVQPQIRLDTKQISGEVLLRWTNTEGEIISPAEFIPVAEESGLIHPLGDWVLERTIKLISQWQSQPNFGGLAMNLSAWQFADSEFVFKLFRSVQNAKINAELLTLELTETSLLRDVNETKLRLIQLRKGGFRVSLDDFGTGYSSLSYLRELSLDEIKIDKSFVDEINGENGTPLIESIISIAEHLNLEVLAEGVETENQQNALSKIGCRAFQGYYFARPLTIDAFTDYLKQA
ncbi:putative bifunctional diguanylate cyclase/phosphodiesterase [Gayadomonas joobiniege]|uniref:putative bifunctional diguanylate cyclase/phosphodiesterase n=1 Tax=Gayadomonas joobiniege TaxID=1234606 RepID=UPI00036DE05C|nr:EAL domain-containing protein [Gayadomonas joobiniege]